jgi:ABC-type dipeptide/oligopeptide/nickel transport system permease component
VGPGGEPSPGPGSKEPNLRLFGYVLRRLVQMIPVLVGITLLAFLFIQLLPGDPIVIMLGGKATSDAIAAAHEKFGLDKPLVVQYLIFLRNALVGDLGTSITQRAPVTDIIVQRLGPSLFLLTYSSLVAILLTVPLALLSAANADRPLDHVIRGTGMIGFAMPPFWLGLLLMLLFGLKLGWFPISGWGQGLLGHLRGLFLPSVTIGLYLAPVLTQSLRASMLDVMQAEYIEAARAKGLSPTRIMLKHVLRNALIPTVTVLAVNIGWLIGGAVIVEMVFSIPGLGMLLIRSVLYRDYPTIQGLTLIFGILVMTVNLLADLSYAVIDPRVVYQ